MLKPIFSSILAFDYILCCFCAESNDVVKFITPLTQFIRSYKQHFLKINLKLNINLKF